MVTTTTGVAAVVDAREQQRRRARRWVSCCLRLGSQEAASEWPEHGLMAVMVMTSLESTLVLCEISCRFGLGEDDYDFTAEGLQLVVGDGGLVQGCHGSALITGCSWWVIAVA
ncbi:hypothetical protein M0R45_027457 [Rubus argutus]|uniref:Uncharacterized protein n=1 Tax=Rubus argutus TaxID=59490 RepID=A0AAW1X338_RUBAR